MAKATAPTCPHCQRLAVLVSGAQLHPHLPKIAGKWFWRCGPCDAHVACRGTTRRAVGVPANAELRRARDILYKRRLVPIWDAALALYSPEDSRARAIIRNTARKRVYEWLAWKLGLDPKDTALGELTLEECRRAWLILGTVDYATIRAWAKARPRPAKQQEHAAHG